MSVVKKIMRTFCLFRKTGKSVRLPESCKFCIAPRNKFMGIALVAYVPHNCVLRTVEYAVKRNRKFNYAQIACKMTAVLSDYFYNRPADFHRKCFQFFLRKMLYIFR